MPGKSSKNYYRVYYKVKRLAENSENMGERLLVGNFEGERAVVVKRECYFGHRNIYTVKK